MHEKNQKQKNVKITKTKVFSKEYFSNKKQ